MDNHTFRHEPLARLCAVAAATILGTSLVASVAAQREAARISVARPGEIAQAARLDESIAEARAEAYRNGDLNLADSLERLRAARAARAARPIDLTPDTAP
jgi:hypothetical protein